MNYKDAIQYWDLHDQNLDKLNDYKLNQMVDNFISKHNTCALATGYNDEIRCTPIEYNYYDGIFYLISEGGHKFIGLENNKNVCLAIYEEYKGFGNCNGLQINGIAEIIDSTNPIYKEIFEIKKISLEALNKMGHPMYLIKIVPKEINFLSSEFKKLGLNTMRQKIYR